MSEIQVKSWEELQNALYAESWSPDLERYRSPYAFRGMPRSSMRLDTSLMRLGGGYTEKEHHLLRNFRKYASRNYKAFQSLQPGDHPCRIEVGDPR